MASAYVKNLNRQLELSPIRPASTPDLRQRFVEWYANTPEITRDRAFAMVELEQALQTQGRYLSPVLLSLGWTRKRRWSSRGQYNRYWVPPSPATHCQPY